MRENAGIPFLHPAGAEMVRSLARSPVLFLLQVLCALLPGPKQALLVGRQSRLLSMRQGAAAEAASPILWGILVPVMEKRSPARKRAFLA